MAVILPFFGIKRFDDCDTYIVVLYPNLTTGWIAQCSYATFFAKEHMRLVVKEHQALTVITVSIVIVTLD
jgi:hypothetical protein